jgi:predicted transcriptional regulator
MTEEKNSFEITRGNSRDVRTLFDWFGGHEQRITLYDDLHAGCPTDELNRKYNDAFLHDQTNRLEGFGLITESDGECRLTDLGERVYDEFLDLAEYSLLISDMGPLLESIENWDDNLPQVEMFKDSEVIRENDLEPTKGIARYREEIRESSQIREIVCDVMDSRGFKQLTDERSLNAECLYTPEIMKYILNDDKRRAIAKTHQSEGIVTHYRLDEDVPFNLTILDHTTIIWTTRADAPGHRVLVSSDSAEVREWGIDLYNSKKANAEEHTFEEV